MTTTNGNGVSTAAYADQDTLVAGPLLPELEHDNDLGDSLLASESLTDVLARYGIRADVIPGVPAREAGPGKCHAYKPTPRTTASGETVWSAAFRHPISGAQTAKVASTEEGAWEISRVMFELWVANGRPQAKSTVKAHAKVKATKVKESKATAAPAPEPEEVESPFDPAIQRLWGKTLTVVMIGVNESDQPVMALRHGKETFLVNVQGYKPQF